MEKNYTMVSPNAFQRAVEHESTFISNDDESTEIIQQWYEDNGFFLPVFYVVRYIEGASVKAVIDGWKKVLYARANGIDALPSVEIKAEGEELISIMMQLQRSGHNGLMALYHMSKALYPKHYKGQGHRGDLAEKELDEQTIGKDGRKLNIYERIGRDLGIKSGNKIKYILKVGDKCPLHFERIENSRFTLYQAYLDCKDEEEDFEPSVPKVKEPIYHTTMTSAPEFSTPDVSNIASNNYRSTSTDDFEETIDELKNEAEDLTPNKNVCSVLPIGQPFENEESTEAKLITVSGLCQCCGKETVITINLNQYL